MKTNRSKHYSANYATRIRTRSDITTLPPTAMASIPGLSDLLRNLQNVQDDQQQPLDGRAFDRVEANLTDANATDLVQTLLPRLIAILPLLQQDPDPVARLTIKLLRHLSFQQCLALSSPESLVEALSSPFTSINSLALATVVKAAASPDEVSSISHMPGLVEQLLRLWLTSPDTEVATKTEDVLLRLLTTDCPEKPSTGSPVDGHRPAGSGSLWTKMFEGDETYEIILKICSWSEHGDASIGRKAKTQAQARLLTILPKILLLDWQMAATSHCPAVDVRYTTSAHHAQGLLGFAANAMVDTDDDVLMHMSLIDFYQQLLRSSPRGFAYLVHTGLHTQLLTSALLPLKPDSGGGVSLERLLRTQELLYLAAYAQTYPSAFLSQSLGSPRPSLLVDQVTAAISRSLRSTTKSEDQAAHLSLLASIPRIALLHPSRAVYLSIAPERATPEALHALSALFHGPDASGPSLNHCSGSGEAEAEADPLRATEPIVARLLHARYISKHPNTYASLLSLAQTVALHPTALAALHFLSQLATARWAPCPSPSSPSSLPSGFSQKGANFCTTVSHPTTAHDAGPKAEYILPAERSLPEGTKRSGLAALLAFPASRMVVPFALGKAQRFSGLVGGLGGAEDAAYKVAAARFEFVRVLAEGLDALAEEGEEVEALGIADLRGLREVLRRRVGEGIWGGEGGEGEAMVATMDA